MQTKQIEATAQVKERVSWMQEVTGLLGAEIETRCLANVYNVCMFHSVSQCFTVFQDVSRCFCVCLISFVVCSVLSSGSIYI